MYKLKDLIFFGGVEAYSFREEEEGRKNQAGGPLKVSQSEHYLPTTLSPHPAPNLSLSSGESQNTENIPCLFEESWHAILKTD